MPFATGGGAQEPIACALSVTEEPLQALERGIDGDMVLLGCSKSDCGNAPGRQALRACIVNS